MLYHKLGDSQQAIRDITRAIEIVPVHEHYFFTRAKIYLEIQAYENALEDFLTAREMKKGSEPETTAINRFIAQIEEALKE